MFTGPTQISTTALTITAAMVGKWLDNVYVWDPGIGRLLHYLQAVELSSVVGGAAYVTQATERFAIGSTGTPSSPATECLIAGVEGGDGFVPTASEIYSAHRATRARIAAGKPPLAGIEGKTTWRVHVPKAWNPPTRLRDEVGTQDAIFAVGTAANLVHLPLKGVFV